MDTWTSILFPCLLGTLITKTFDWMKFVDGYPTMRCEPLTVKACLEAVPYNTTTLPNMFGHESQLEVENAIHEFDPLVKVNCNPYLKQLLGFIYCPPCTVLNSPIPPCRDYCKKAAKGCIEVLRKFGFEPGVLNCDTYPVTGLCIKTNASYSNISADTNTSLSTQVFSTNENWYTGTGGSFEIETGSDNDLDASTPVDLFLISNTEHSIQLININAVNTMDTVTVFSGPVAEMCTAVDYYPPRRYVFWASNLEGKIFRGKLVTDSLRGVRQIIDTESATVLSLAVDWLLGILFWTETFPAKLRTSSLSGRQVTTVLSDNMENPVCLTLDPAEGLVFWIDRRGSLFDSWGTLESYSLVTEERRLLINITSSMLDEAGRPKSLSADMNEKRIYWVDARSESLHSIKYDGTDHRVLLRRNDYLHEPDSVVVYKSHVVWTDIETSSLVWVEKDTGSNLLVLKNFEYNPPQNIRIFHPKAEIADGVLTYDKSSLTDQWQEISSRENMEIIDYDDDEEYDEAYYKDYKETRQNKKKSNTKNGACLAQVRKNIIIYSMIFSILLMH